MFLKYDMPKRVVKVPSNFDFILFGDLHRGSMGSDDSGIGKLIDHIGYGKATYAGFMGDAMEGIMIDDKRYDFSSKIGPMDQMNEVKKLFHPVRKKIMYWQSGNHELSLLKFGNIGKSLAKDLDIWYGKFSCVIEFQDKHGRLFDLFSTHGTGRFVSQAKDFRQEKANTEAALQKKLNRKYGTALVMACGHYHKLITANPDRRLILSHENGELEQTYVDYAASEQGFIQPDFRWYVCTGSFLKSYIDDIDVVGYAERAGYDPVELGYQVIEVRGRKIVGIRKVLV